MSKVFIRGQLRLWTPPVAVALALTGCAAHYAPSTVGDPYGFFSGIWHGFALPWAILANLISWALGLVDIRVFESIQIIGRPNTGVFWYYVGFVVGLATYSGGGR